MALEYLGKASTGDGLYMAVGRGKYADGTMPVVAEGMRVACITGNVWRVMDIDAANERICVAREPNLDDTYWWNVSSLFAGGYPITHSRFMGIGRKLRGIECVEYHNA